MAAKSIITLTNISKKYHDLWALNGINLEIKSGERIGLIGANGSGKTTLVETIIGLIKATSGTIKYGFKFQKNPQEKIGIQFQDSSYPTGLSVKDIIKFTLDIYKAKIPVHELEELLKVFQVKEFYKARAKSLSGGQMQRLNVLLAIIHRPEILILDEISTGLDILAKEEILSYVKQYVAKGHKTLILISHNMSEIRTLCERLIVLKKGQLVADQLVADIKVDLHQYVKQYLPKPHWKVEDEKKAN